MEHKLIQGGEIFLPFARSRIKALRAAGLEYASQQFEVGGASVKVRIVGEHEYISIKGGGFVSVYSNVQYPETAPSAVSLPGNPGAKLLIGTFPETVHDDVRDRPGFLSKTRFATTPFAKHWIRRSRGTADTERVGAGINEIPTFPGTGGIYLRVGTDIGVTQRFDFFTDGVIREQLVLPGPYLGWTRTDTNPHTDAESVGVTTNTYDWATSTSEAIPCVVSGTAPCLATLDTETTEHYFNRSEALGIDPFGDDVLLGRTERGTRAEPGLSKVRLRRLRRASSADSADTPYGAIDLGAQPYSRSKTVIYDMPRVPTGNGGFTYLDRTNAHVLITNDIECTMACRRWHALERVAVAPNGAAFALRETSRLETSQLTYPALNTPELRDGGFTASISRGYTLSFASPDGVVQNHVVTGDLGPHGYIDGIFPSADGRKAYIYYGLHDSSEALPALSPANFSTFLPLHFIEYLDVVEIEGEGYTLTKKETITLGAVKLRTFGRFLGDDGLPNGVPTDEIAEVAARTDHFNSKLHGAALEVGGYIWADRYCYDVKANVFMALPDFTEYAKPSRFFDDARMRDQITGPDDDRTSYLSVSASGRSACYVLIKFERAL
ncbi:MAG: hypothetical protein JWR74_2850, partial [Polaromonas sp.]|nr:hypothetical protein [Polaromonas sp.]